MVKGVAQPISNKEESTKNSISKDYINNKAIRIDFKFLNPDPEKDDGSWSSGLYKSVEDAAGDFGKIYNNNSIITQREYGAYIYKVKIKCKIYYSFSNPIIGDTDAVDIPYPSPFKNTKAIIHTHANYDKKCGNGNENFSGTENQGDQRENLKYDVAAAAKHNMPFYLVTPGGKLKIYKYRPWLGFINKEISNDRPKDPNYEE